MTSLLYLVGLIIGAAIFIYLYSTFQTGKEKIRDYREKKNPATPPPSLNPERVDYFSIKRAPGTRLCPLCGSELSKYESLFASEVEEQGRKKIRIHGCRFCYKEDSE